MLKITNLMTVSPFVLASLFSGIVQAVSPVEIRLTTAKTVFNDSEPVDVVIALTNTSGVDAYVSKGFFAGDFHLDIDLNGPDGNIRPFSTVGSPEPPPG